MNLFELVSVAVLAAMGAGLTLHWRSARLRALSRDRLEPVPSGPSAPPPGVGPPFPPRYLWVPMLVGLSLGAGLSLFTPLPPLFLCTFGLIVALLGMRVETWWAGERRRLIEAQFADGLDLMISTLRAGASVMVALEAAARESKQPLRGQLEEVLGRIRYGDDPQAVLRALERRVPLETFRLFGAALAVHWEVGGSLAPILATVGRTVRDRIELSRRIRAMTTQGRLLIAAVLGTTYFVALVVWRNDPERMEGFLSTKIGQYLVALTFLLQAAGIAWASVLTRMRGS